MKKRHSIYNIGVVGSCALLGVGVFAVLVWNIIIPFFQIDQYLTYVKRKEPLTEDALSRILSHQDILKPNTPYQSDIRASILGKSIALASQQKIDPTLLERTLAIAIEDIARHPVQPEKLADIGLGYLALARLKNNDQDMLANARLYYEQALAQWPDSQNMLFAYIAVLVNQGDFAEAERVADRAIALDPELSLGYYYRGFVQLRKGPGYYDGALADFNRSVDSIGSKSESIVTFYQILFSHYYQNKNTEKVLETARGFVRLNTAESGAYRAIVEYIEKNGRLPRITITQ